MKNKQLRKMNPNRNHVRTVIQRHKIFGFRRVSVNRSPSVFNHPIKEKALLRRLMPYYLEGLTLGDY